MNGRRRVTFAERTHFKCKLRCRIVRRHNPKLLFFEKSAPLKLDRWIIAAIDSVSSKGVSGLYGCLRPSTAASSSDGSAPRILPRDPSTPELRLVTAHLGLQTHCQGAQRPFHPQREAGGSTRAFFPEPSTSNLRSFVCPPPLTLKPSAPGR